MHSNNIMDLKDLKCWRSRMLIDYYALSLFAGLFASIYISTEFLYIKQIVHGYNQLMCLIQLLALSNASSVIAAVIASMYYDFTLKII